MRYNGIMFPTPSPDEVNTFHQNSDRDSSVFAQHHTLGLGPTQASPGNHSHNGKDSKRIKFEDIEGGWMNIDGGTAYTVYGGMEGFDGGSVY
jgi:hypothetical protein